MAITITMLGNLLDAGDINIKDLLPSELKAQSGGRNKTH